LSIAVVFRVPFSYVVLTMYFHLSLLKSPFTVRKFNAVISFSLPPLIQHVGGGGVSKE
jgi:hypothetical protein